MKECIHGARPHECPKCAAYCAKIDLSKPTINTEILLRELMAASAPYLKRKKETPRSQCTTLNKVHKKARKLLDQHPTN